MRVNCVMYIPSSAVFHVAGVLVYRGCNTISEADEVAGRCHARLTFPNPLLNTVLGGFSSMRPLIVSPLVFVRQSLTVLVMVQYAAVNPVPLGIEPPDEGEGERGCGGVKMC